jgi:4-amino-4-deoxychorismate mutase
MNKLHQRTEIGLDVSGVSTNSSQHPDAASVLQSLRDELDRIDGALLDTLRARLELCCRIGELKRAHAIPMMQPARIGVVQQRAAAYAAVHRMNPVFLRSLYDLVIAETCRLEDDIIHAQDLPVATSVGPAFGNDGALPKTL